MIGQGPREVVSPSDGEVTFRRTAFNEDGEKVTLDNFEVEAYSSEIGGRAVLDPDVTVTTSSSMDSGTFVLNIDFTVDIDSGPAGADYLFRYTVSDDSFTRSFEFFHQNGLFNTGFNGNLKTRLSAEHDDIRDTFDDGDTGVVPTNFTTTDNWNVATGSLEYVGSSSPLLKHESEPVPFFRVGDDPVQLDGISDQLTSSATSVYAVLQWDQDTSGVFPVFQLTQSGDVVAEVVNDASTIEIDSDLATAPVYNSGTYAGSPVLLEFRLDSEVRGSGNREISSGPVSRNSGVTPGSNTVELNPNGEPIDLKLFELLVYDEDIGASRGPDRVASYESYFYNLDMTFDTKQVVDQGRGSPDIANHLYFEEDKLENDVYVAGGGNVTKLNEDGTTDVSETFSNAKAVRTDSQGFLYVVDDTQTTKLAPDFTEVWSVSETSNSISVDNEGFVYVGTAKIGPEGNVEDLEATITGLNVTSVSDVVATSGGTVYIGGDLHLPSGSYSIVKIEEDGSAEGVTTPSDVALGPRLTVGLDGALYTLSDQVAKKFVNGNEQWVFGGAIDDGAIEVDQNDNLYVNSNGDGVVKIVQTASGPSQEWSSDASSIANAVDVTTDSDDSVYVLGSDRLEKFTQPGSAPLLEWSFTNLTNAELFDVDPGRISSHWY